MSVKQRIPAGIVDSAFASLATFAVGVYAVRYLDAAGLGLYSLIFSAFILASVVPSSLVFTSARVRLLVLPAPQRLRAYPQTLRIGSAIAVVAALLVLVSLPSAMAVGRPDLLLPLTVTAVLAAWLSPLQDHIRGLLHLGETSWGAAATSIVQAVVVGAAIVGASLAGIAPAWVPFGALVAANATSLAVGVAIARHWGEAPPDDILSFRELRRSGWWFLAMNALARGADFLARTAVLVVATADVLGVAEGARVAARPLSVFVLGISAVVTPRSMEAGQQGLERTGRRIARYANLGVLVVALCYLAAGGFEWALNPMSRLAPIGYTVAWLVPATIAATALQGMLFAEQGEMMGGGRERALAYIEGVSAVLVAGSGFLAGVIGPFVIPLGLAVMSLSRWIGYKIVLRRHYRAIDAADHGAQQLHPSAQR